MYQHCMKVRRCILQRISVIAVTLLFFPLPLFAAAPPSCTIKETNYLGWKAEEMRNPWVKLEIVPQLGGRLMQVTFGSHDFASASRCSR